MFEMRDHMWKPSPTAEKNFGKLNLLNKVSLGLLGLMAVLAMWNVLVAADSLRDRGRELADMEISPANHISGQLILGLALVTLAIYLFKELKFGEFTVGSFVFLGGLAFLALVPVVGEEVQMPLKDQILSITYSECEQGVIVDGRPTDRERCVPGMLGEEDFLLADRDPTADDVTFSGPRDSTDGRWRWNVEARTVYMVHFLVKQPSMDVCEQRNTSVTVDGNYREGGSCMEHEGSAWLVLPLEITPELPGNIQIYQDALD